MADDARPPQHQDHQPGDRAEMEPRPKDSGVNYRGSGKLEGKVAIVTGGDSGIGRAVAVAFAKEGADVAIVYKDETCDAEGAARLITDAGRRCHGFIGDLGDPAFCREVVEKTVERLGRLDILVNNAAEQHVQDRLEDISPEQLERTFRTNIFGCFYMAQAALPHMQEGSVIINTTSVTAFKGNPKLVDYSATKGAQVAFTRSLAEQLMERKIRVNGVAPGPVWTPLIPASFDAEKVAEFGQDNPQGRAADADEIAPAFVYLASEDGRFVTGQIMHVNGGAYFG
jgi:NAD(P)-dependent dehydrogenase (short-subunit alcohol dehydrogenase family)